MRTHTSARVTDDNSARPAHPQVCWELGGALFGGTAVYPLSKYAGMEGDYVNGTVEEQAAPQTLQELQAAGVHAMPVVAGFQEALVAQAAQLQAAAGTPAGMTGDDSTPGMHMGGSISGRGRMSSGSFKNRSGPSYCQVEQCGEPLEGLKEYHQRYKVCEEHLKIPYIIRDGQQVRFCQQCGRFQPLEDFDDAKRSCRVRLQRHNARRRKKGPREGNSGGGMDHHHHMGDYGSMGGAAAEMAKLAYPQAAMVSGKDIQAMQEALHFASTTLMHSSQVVTGKPAGEEGGEEGEGGGGVAMGPNSMPFVPQPDVMMLLLKGYAAMFHYALDSATLRGLAQPSDLPDQQAAAAAGGGMGLGAVDALQMQHLMQAQGFFAGAGMPMLLPSGEAVEGMLPEEGQEAGGEGQQQQEQQPGGAEEEQQQQLQEHGAGEQQQQEHAAAVAAAHAAAGGGELTAEQVAAALIQPMPQDAAAAEGAMAAAAALASAAGAHVPSSAGYGEAGGEQEDHAEAMQQ